MKRFLVLTVIALSVIATCVYADDFYFGGMTNQVYRFRNIGDNEGGEADAIKDSLGFNMLFGCGPTAAELIKLGTDQGFYTFPSMNRTQSAGDDYWALRNANYAIIEAEDVDHSIRFTNQAGAGDTSGIYYAPLATAEQDSIFLSGLSYRHWLNINASETLLNYVMQVNIRPDSSFYEISEGEQVGFLLVNGDTLISIPYHPDSTGTRVYDLEDRIFPAGEWDYVKIGTYQRCIFGVDWFKVYNEDGFRIVEDHLVAESIKEDPDALPYFESINKLMEYNNDYFLYHQFLKTIIEILRKNYERMAINRET